MNAGQRVIVPELLDHAEPSEAQVSLRDLIWINRYLGGYRIVRKIFRDLVHRDQAFTVLDVGAASGDMPERRSCAAALGSAQSRPTGGNTQRSPSTE